MADPGAAMPPEVLPGSFRIKLPEVLRGASIMRSALAAERRKSAGKGGKPGAPPPISAKRGGLRLIAIAVIIPSVFFSDGLPDVVGFARDGLPDVVGFARGLPSRTATLARACQDTLAEATIASTHAAAHGALVAGAEGARDGTLWHVVSPFVARCVASPLHHLRAATAAKLRSTALCGT